MITSFFKTTKPIHYVMTITYLLLVFVGFQINSLSNNFSWVSVFKSALLFVLLVFIMLLLDFISKKNALTKINSFKILFFTLLLCLCPFSFQSLDIAVSAIFILLAFRRILSLKSDVNLYKKTFDIGLWIAFATVFHFWNCLFFVVLIFALAIYNIRQIKYWLTIIFGIATVALLTLNYNIIFNDVFFCQK